MKQEISEDQYAEFFELDYEKRLLYWDVNKLDFTSQSFGTDTKLFLHIKPDSLQTIISYNRWVIDHWRNKFFNQYFDAYSTYGNEILFRKHEDYISKYDKTVELKNIDEVKDYIRERIKMCDEFIVKTKVKKTLADLVYLKIRDHNEEEIYTYTEGADVLIRLKSIAKVWDIIVYKIFLERKLSVLGIKRKTVRNKVEMKKLNSKKIQFLYDELIIGGYINNEGGYINFKQILLMDDSINLIKLNWTNLRGGDEINKVPLIILAEHLVNEDSFGQNTFIVDNFVTYTKKNKVIITRKELNQSRKGIKGKNIENQPIMSIISKMLEK